MSTLAVTPDYPAGLEIDYPESLDRLSTVFRLLLAIPAAILMTLVTSAARSLGLAIVLMLLFRGRYPAPWFAWMRYLVEYQTRVGAYLGLLTDRYPSTTDEQAVHVLIAAPEEVSLSRWLPLVKWLLALPHWVVLYFLLVATMVVAVIAWFAILVTGRYPRGLFDFVVGVNRWTIRASAYAFILNTDRYPPFSLR